MSHGTRMSESCHRCDTRRNQGLLYCCPPATFWMSPGVSTVWCGMLQWVVMWCSVLQCVAVCCSVLQCVPESGWVLTVTRLAVVSAFTEVCCSALQCVTALQSQVNFLLSFVLCSLRLHLQCMVVWCSVIRIVAMCRSLLQYVAVCYIML